MLVAASCCGFKGGKDPRGHDRVPPSLRLSLECPSGAFTFLSHPLGFSAPPPLNQGLGL